MRISLQMVQMISSVSPSRKIPFISEERDSVNFCVNKKNEFYFSSHSLSSQVTFQRLQLHQAYMSIR